MKKGPRRLEIHTFRHTGLLSIVSHCIENTPFTRLAVNTVNMCQTRKDMDLEVCRYRKYWLEVGADPVPELTRRVRLARRGRLLCVRRRRKYIMNRIQLFATACRVASDISKYVLPTVRCVWTFHRFSYMLAVEKSVVPGYNSTGRC